MKKLFQLAATDHRITISEGSILGNFKRITNFLIPFSEGTVYEEVIKETLKVLKM